MFLPKICTLKIMDLFGFKGLRKKGDPKILALQQNLWVTDWVCETNAGRF